MQNENEEIEIIKLHVRNLPCNVTRKDLIRCFRKYGEINSCFIKFSSTIEPYPIYAFITYETPDGALRAQNATIKINGYKLEVSPANPWHQHKTFKHKSQNPPRKYISKKHVKNVNEDDSEECNGNNGILDVLNEDCIIKIFSYMTLQELIRSERVSKKWKYFVEEKYKSFVEFDTNDYENDYNHSAIHSVLKRIGPNLRKLSIDQNDIHMYHCISNYIPNLISKYCPNLLELRVKNVIVKSWNNTMKALKSIKVLEFTDCETISDETFKFCSDQLEELIINEVKGPIGLVHVNVTHLKKLSIMSTQINEFLLLKKLEKSNQLKQLWLQNVKVNDKFIKQVIKLLPNLSHLSLCSLNIDDSVYAISKLKYLKSLQLKSIYNLCDNMIQSICQGCTEIVSLDISTAFDLETFSGLTNQSIRYIWGLKYLEELDISGLELTDAPFMELGYAEKGSKLRLLVCRKIHEITQNAINHIFLNCPRLEKMDLYGCCELNSNLIDQLVTIIHSKGCVPNRYSLNLSHIMKPENPICSCLNVNFINEPNFFVDFFDDDYDDYEDNSDGFDDYFEDVFSDIEDDDIFPYIFVLPNL